MSALELGLWMLTTALVVHCLFDLTKPLRQRAIVVETPDEDPRRDT